MTKRLASKRTPRSLLARRRRQTSKKYSKDYGRANSLETLKRRSLQRSWRRLEAAPTAAARRRGNTSKRSSTKCAMTL